MLLDEKLNIPIWELEFPTRIVNVLVRYNIKTIGELVTLSPQDIMIRRNSSPAQAKTVAEKTAAWFDEHELAKTGYPLFSGDYSNKINGVTIKKAQFINRPYIAKKTSSEKLYDELDAVQTARINLNNQIKKDLHLNHYSTDEWLKITALLTKKRLKLNQREQKAHKQLMELIHQSSAE